MDDYWILVSDRHICARCQIAYKETKAAAELKAGKKLKKCDIPGLPQYTFSSTNPYTLSQMSHSRGELFRGIVMPQTAIDKDVLDHLRMAHNCGTSTLAVSEMLHEARRKRYALEELMYEEKLNRFKSSAPMCLEALKKVPKFGSFRKKDGYCGSCPSAKFLRTVFKDWHKTVRSHYDQQVKLRGTQTLDVDASDSVPGIWGWRWRTAF